MCSTTCMSKHSSVAGTAAHRHPETLARIARGGHLLANHSADHVHLIAALTAIRKKLLDKLRDVDRQIEPLMKPRTSSISAPYGA